MNPHTCNMKTTTRTARPAATEITEGAEMLLIATGEYVRIVGVDSDPTCAVWICFPCDPDTGTDRDAFVMRAELAPWIGPFPTSPTTTTTN